MQITTVKLTPNNGYIVNNSISVPPDPANSLYQEVQAWIAAGNTPEPADASIDDPGDVARTGARGWFTDNPSGKLLFTLTIAELSAEIASLVDALFPVATSPNRTKLKLLLMAMAVCVRLLVKREAL